MSTKMKRLLEQFRPERYELRLEVDAAGMRFAGQVVITGQKVGRPSERLTFHQKELKITSAEIVRHDKKGDESITPARINSHKSFDEVRLHAGRLLYPGNYTVTMDFTGTITKQMTGIYPCFFKHKGSDKVIIATQFESHHAREAFPCIDEPAAKAVFNLTLVAPKDEVVLSNTPVEREEAVDSLSLIVARSSSDRSSKKLQTTNYKLTMFEPTPIMSPYLLAFAVGELHSAEATTKDGVLMRTWASVVQPVSHLRYATDEAVKTLEFFTEYFDTAFPLSKCDQLALPDFDAGAMENWGLVTYREIALLSDPANRSLSAEQYIAMVVAHELSHQWFGNLVTMEWWDDLWLNESFATLMEHLALDALHPDWFQWEQYAISDVIYTSSRDVYQGVQPIRVAITDPALLETLYDPAIVYCKGGRLLKMLREWIGDEAFRAGLNAYFTKHAYSNTTRDDLWKALAEASSHDVPALMNPWLEQPGMPLLSVKHSGHELELSQNRFVLDATDDPSLWPIPLLTDKPLPLTLFENQATRIKYNQPETPIFNLHGSGHYVVHYEDPAARANLAAAIAERSIASESRINVLNDMLLLARSGHASLIDALDIALTCRGEPREAVWGMLSRVVGTAHALSEGDDASKLRLHTLRRQLAADWFAKLGWDNRPADDPNSVLLRQLILGWLVAGEDKAVLAEALKRYKQAKTADDLAADLRSLILTAAVRHGPPSVIPNLIKQYQSSSSAEIQSAICSALTELRDPAEAVKLIEQALGPDGFVRPQDIFRWFAYLMRNRYSREAAWNWLTTSWPRLEQLFGNSKMFDDFPTYAAAALNTPEWQKRYNDFFTPLLTNKVLERNIKIAQADIAARVAWRRRDEPLIREWLRRV